MALSGGSFVGIIEELLFGYDGGVSRLQKASGDGLEGKKGKVKWTISIMQ